MLLRKSTLVLLSLVLAITSSSSVFAAATRETFYNANNISRYDPEAEIGTCSPATAPGGTAEVGPNFFLGTDPVERRVNLIKALMKDFGLQPHQAAGPVGNFMVESGGEHLPPDVNQNDTKGAPPNSSSLGYSWAQWSGSRKTAFVKWYQEKGYQQGGGRATDAAAYGYLKLELLSDAYASTIVELKKQTSPEDAAKSFEATFEKAGKPVLDRRMAGARKAFEEYQGKGPSGGSSSGSPVNCANDGDAAINGDTAFPLIISKTRLASENSGLFANGTTSKGGHPYTAYDIMAPPGTRVVAFMPGVVKRISEDKCPGRLVSIYKAAQDKTVSYLHLSFSNHIEVGKEVKPGDPVGIVGGPGEGCGTPHLHIDVVNGGTRVGCTRENCPVENQKYFVDIGRDLYNAYELLK